MRVGGKRTGAGATALSVLLVPALAAAFSMEQQAAPVIDHDPGDLAAQGVVSWDTLRALDLSYESPFPGQTSVSTSFSEELERLDGQPVKLIGFVYPLEAGETHDYFLLSAFPPSCPFCLPGGATDLVEVRAAEPVPYSIEPVTLSGRLVLLHGDAGGLLYRLEDAAPLG